MIAVAGLNLNFDIKLPHSRYTAQFSIAAIMRAVGLGAREPANNFGAPGMLDRMQPMFLSTDMAIKYVVAFRTLLLGVVNADQISV